MPLTTWQNSSPHSSFSRLTVIVRRPIRHVRVSPVARRTVTRYSGCLPSPFGHHSCGCSIVMTCSAAVVSGRVNTSPSGAVISADHALSPAISGRMVTSTTPSWCACSISAFSSRAVSHVRRKIGRQMPASGRRGPQSQPNMQCALRRWRKPGVASEDSQPGASSAFFAQ